MSRTNDRHRPHRPAPAEGAPAPRGEDPGPPCLRAAEHGDGRREGDEPRPPRRWPGRRDRCGRSSTSTTRRRCAAPSTPRELHDRRERPAVRVGRVEPGPRACPRLRRAPRGRPRDRVPLLAHRHGLPADRDPSRRLRAPADRPSRRSATSSSSSFGRTSALRASRSATGSVSARSPRTRCRPGTWSPDAHLVALMLENDVRTIWTRDRDYRRFAAHRGPRPLRVHGVAIDVALLWVALVVAWTPDKLD